VIDVIAVWVCLAFKGRPKLTSFAAAKPLRGGILFLHTSIARLDDFLTSRRVLFLCNNTKKKGDLKNE